MEKIFNSISVCIGVTVGSFISLLGGYDAALKALVIVIILDYVTGILKAIYNKELSSQIGYKGIVKKVLVFVVVALANVVQVQMGVELIREIAIIFFATNEGLSILENASQMGLPIPQKIKDVLLQLRGEGAKE
jgi:toxin secretion/phage lysis holin